MTVLSVPLTCECVSDCVYPNSYKLLQEEKDQFKFQIAPLTAESFYSWSNNMEIVLQGKGL